MCTEPLYAIRLKTKYDDKFKRFKKRTSLIVLKSVREIGKDTSQLNYNREYYDLLMISCGQCLQCRLQRVKQRAIMSICEALEHDHNSFITLTFGYPQTYHYYRHEKGLSPYLARKKAHFHEWSLEKDTFQKFMKNLRFWHYNYQLGNYLISIGRSDLALHKNGERKSHIRLSLKDRLFLLKDFKPKKIRCMHCGEYGEKKGRPHHHAILFGFQFPDLEEVYENGKKYYVSKILASFWPYGIHRIGECTYNSCAYVSRYVTKKINGNNSEPYYNGRKPEYITYSSKPVLGANYFIKNYREIVTTQELTVVADKKYSCHMPKSYDNLLYKIDKDMFYEMKERRVNQCLTDLDKLLSSKRSIYAKLDSNQAICMATLKKLVRSYEKGAINYDEYFKKAKAFGVNVRHFIETGREIVQRFLDKKTYKSHQGHSTNEELHKKYYNFELARRRHLNNCFQLKLSDEEVERRICFYTNMPNPFKCTKRGYMLPDEESSEYDYGIE